MSTSISWSIEGDKQVSRKLEGLKNNLKDFRPAFKSASDMLVGIFSKDVFSTKGSVIGETWARLSPMTIRQKVRRGFGAQPLINTGTMQGNFKTIVESDSAVIHNSTDYFKYHQSNKPRSKIPRRVMMKIGNSQKVEVVRIFQKYIQDSVNKS